MLQEVKEKLAEGITAAAKENQQPDPVAASASVGIVVEKAETVSAASTTVVVAADRE